MRNDLRAFIAAIFASALIVLTVHTLQAGPSSLEGKSKGYLSGLLFDYQTLITGIAAVAAATVTVRAMVKTERETAKRHRQILGASLRGEALQVDRLLAKRMPIFEHCCRVFEDALECLPSRFDPEDLGPEIVHSALTAALHANDSIKTEISSKEWQEAEALFDGRLAADIALIATLLSRFRPALTEACANLSDLQRNIREQAEKRRKAPRPEPLAEVVHAAHHQMMRERDVLRINDNLQLVETQLPNIILLQSDILGGFERLKERYADVVI